MVCRDGVNISGLIEAGEGVGIAADTVDHLHVDFIRHVRRATKHHVLEHMRETLAAGTLIARTDVIEHADMNHRCCLQRGIDHPQSVIKGFFFELNGGNTLRSGREAEKAGKQRRESARRCGRRESHANLLKWNKKSNPPEYTRARMQK